METEQKREKGEIEKNELSSEFYFITFYNGIFV